MENRDTRYDIIKPMIADGKVMSFNDIFKYIPKTVVARDLGKKVDRFTELMNKVEDFTLGEMFYMGGLFRLSESEILKLAENEYLIHKNENNKPRKKVQ